MKSVSQHGRTSKRLDVSYSQRLGQVRITPTVFEGEKTRSDDICPYCKANPQPFHIPVKQQFYHGESV